MVQNTDVFSCTTQVFLNCLRKGYLKLYQVVFLILLKLIAKVLLDNF